MKKLFIQACIALAAMASWASALEISDLQLPLFRADADAKLGKNYTFQILQDASIRRTWSMRGKTVTVDFDSSNNQAICVVISYDQPVSRKVALEDCRLLGGDKVAEGVRWAKTKKDAMEKVGMSNAHVLKLSDSSYLFREDEGKDKSVRVTLYAQAPKTNRFAIPAIQGDGTTALGNAGGHADIKALIQDEMQRQGASSPTPGAVAGHTAEADSSPAAGKPGRTTIPSLKSSRTAMGKSPGMGTTQPDEITRPSFSQQGSGLATHTPALPGSDAASTGAPGTQPASKSQPGNLLEALGLDNPTPVQYCIGGIILLVLLMLIGGVLSSARSKARSRANFQAVSAARPMVKKPVRKSAPAIRKR